ncbi:hypothetical protein ACFQS6_12455 [Xanthomonas populi]
MVDAGEHHAAPRKRCDIGCHAPRLSANNEALRTAAVMSRDARAGNTDLVDT